MNQPVINVSVINTSFINFVTSKIKDYFADKDYSLGPVMDWQPWVFPVCHPMAAAPLQP